MHAPLPDRSESLDVFRTQYDSKGAVKPFRYMDGPWVLDQKASCADVVSIVF